MRRYSDPVEVRSGPRSGAVQGPAPGRDGVPVDDTMASTSGSEAVDVTGARAPEAFIWRGR